MTLRTMAKILGISPAYLSLLINGKRKWRGDLEERYQTLVNTSVNNENRVGEEKVVPRKGLEPPLSYEKRILSPPRLPFRHLGTINTAGRQQIEIILESLSLTRRNVGSFKAKK
tara:strand:- start:170 stop:511 length:342 start_codon:yes stop_codon:yes gene_type:complete